jgi:hypothetical protein
LAGTTYYYRIWRHDVLANTYVLDSEDFATTYACSQIPSIDVPPEWYQEPTCDMYYQTVLWPAMNYAILAYQFPANYFCMVVTFFLISVCCVASFPVAMAGSAGSPKSMAVPFIIGAVLIMVTAIAGAIPLGISIVSFIALGGVAVFIWNKV